MENLKNTQNNSKEIKKRVDFFDLLCLLFIGLKLTGFINWSWFIILLPLYYILLIQVIIFVFYMVLDVIEFFVNLFKKILKNNKEK